MPRRQGLITVNVPTMNELLYGKPKKKKTTKKKTTAKKTPEKIITPTKREHIHTLWKEKIVKKQRGYCACKNCAKEHNGKKKKIDIYSNFDHIRPLALGGKNILSNLQGLCPLCHMAKTREDRLKISQYRKKHGIKSTSKKTVTKKSPKMVTVEDMFGNKKRVAINKTKVVTNIFGKKARVLKD